MKKIGWISLTLSCLVFYNGSNADIPRQDCETLVSSFCKGLGYKQTAFSPITQLAIEAEILEYQSLTGTACSPFLRIFLCFSMLPRCNTDVKNLIKPCKSVCRRMQRDCEAKVEFQLATWPQALDCSYYSTKSNGYCLNMQDVRKINIFSSKRKASVESGINRTSTAITTLPTTTTTPTTASATTSAITSATTTPTPTITTITTQTTTLTTTSATSSTPSITISTIIPTTTTTPKSTSTTIRVRTTQTTTKTATQTMTPTTIQTKRTSTRTTKRLRGTIPATKTKRTTTYLSTPKIIDKISPTSPADRINTDQTAESQAETSTSPTQNVTTPWTNRIRPEILELNSTYIGDLNLPWLPRNTSYTNSWDLTSYIGQWQQRLRRIQRPWYYIPESELKPFVTSRPTLSRNEYIRQRSREMGRSFNRTSTTPATTIDSDIIVTAVTEQTENGTAVNVNETLEALVSVLERLRQYYLGRFNV